MCTKCLCYKTFVNNQCFFAEIYLLKFKTNQISGDVYIYIYIFFFHLEFAKVQLFAMTLSHDVDK